MQIEGYPSAVLLLVLGIGSFLAVIRPYWAFLFGLFLITAGHTGKFNQTRLTGLGPYLNLADACVLIAFAGFFFETIAAKRPVRLPQIVPLIVSVLIIAAAQTFWKFGWTYETIRALRWGLQLPIFIFLGANMVTSADRARTLIGVLLAAALAAALQHVCFAADTWMTRSLSMETYETMRTISYWGGGMASAFLLMIVVEKIPAGRGRQMFFLWAGFLLLATLFLNQTRSIWLGTLGAIPCLLVLFRTRHPFQRIARFAVAAGILVVVSSWAVQRVMPGFSPLEMATGRLAQLTPDNPKSRIHTQTRVRAFNFEMDAWLNGTVLAGRGLWFVQKMRVSGDPEKDIAFAHLGYVTYLSQLGMMGFIIYAIYLPWGIIRGARQLWYYANEPHVRYVALLGGASITFLSLMFAMSSQFLSPGFEAPGVLYGAIWSFNRSRVGVWPESAHL